jgi:hypothetical protein
MVVLARQRWCTERQGRCQGGLAAEVSNLFDVGMKVTTPGAVAAAATASWFAAAGYAAVLGAGPSVLLAGTLIVDTAWIIGVVAASGATPVRWSGIGRAIGDALPIPHRLALVGLGTVEVTTERWPIATVAGSALILAATLDLVARAWALRSPARRSEASAAKTLELRKPALRGGTHPKRADAPERTRRNRRHDYSDCPSCWELDLHVHIVRRRLTRDDSPGRPYP